jgi:Ca2+/H+ antiporter
MEAINKNKSILRCINLFFRSLVAIVIALFYTGVGTLFAQTDTVSNVNAPNEAMKSVFQQLKKEVKTNDTLSSILMIIGVILIVCVAVYLSFKSDPNDKKTPLKSSAPKKA